MNRKWTYTGNISSFAQQKNLRGEMIRYIPGFAIVLRLIVFLITFQGNLWMLCPHVVPAPVKSLFLLAVPIVEILKAAIFPPAGYDLLHMVFTHDDRDGL